MSSKVIVPKPDFLTATCAFPIHTYGRFNVIVSAAPMRRHARLLVSVYTVLRACTVATPNKIKAVKRAGH
jgi:hypothetical protein